jgi:hypothetical protein
MTYPEKRELTGAYLRIKRDGYYEPIDIADLTDSEITEHFSTRDDAVRWLVFMVKELRQLAEQFDITRAPTTTEGAKS